MPVLMVTVIMVGATTAMLLITAIAGAIGHFVIITLITIMATGRIDITTTGRRALVLTGKAGRGAADTAAASPSRTEAEDPETADEAAFPPEGAGMQEAVWVGADDRAWAAAADADAGPDSCR